MKSCKTLKGGLQEVADDLQVSRYCLAGSHKLLNLFILSKVSRIGPQHQAGSDSLLTATTFFKMRGKFFEDAIDLKYMVSYSPPCDLLLPPTKLCIPHLGRTIRSQLFPFLSQLSLVSPTRTQRSDSLPSPITNYFFSRFSKSGTTTISSGGFCRYCYFEPKSEEGG